MVRSINYCERVALSELSLPSISAGALPRRLSVTP